MGGGWVGGAGGGGEENLLFIVAGMGSRKKRSPLITDMVAEEKERWRIFQRIGNKHIKK